MDIWHLVLYVGAIGLALRSLVGLMDNHRNQMRHDLLQRELGRRQADRMREATQRAIKENAAQQKQQSGQPAAGSTAGTRKPPAGMSETKPSGTSGTKRAA